MLVSTASKLGTLETCTAAEEPRSVWGSATCVQRPMSRSDLKSEPIFKMLWNGQRCNMTSKAVIDMLNEMRVEDGWLEPLPGKHALIEKRIPDGGSPSAQG